jgi:16S rRNA (uracil1498-N3)-methyltransferase
VQIHRVYETEAFRPGDRALLSAENGRIVRSVLRMQKGDSLVLLNGRGGVAQAELLEVGNKRVAAVVRTVEEVQPIQPSIVLLLALPKGEKAAWVIQKGVELGISKFLFFESAHSVAKCRNGHCHRWTKIAIEALRQSGNPYAPEIHDPVSMDQVLQESKTEDLKIVLDEAEKTHSLPSRLGGAKPRSVVLAIGPEGGWSPDERSRLGAAGFLPTTLGQYVLRTETAAIAASAITRALLS